MFFYQRSFHTKDLNDKVATLYIVATPIGNMDDMTKRALDTLKHVKLILAEDTRQTKKLLTFNNINTYMRRYDDYMDEQDIVDQYLKQGMDMAVVTDAGTPGISDPGHKLVKAALKARINVVPIPGSCAAVTALVASGLNTASFLFIGFLPRKSKSRQDKLQEISSFKETILFYESPFRVIRTLDDILNIMGDRQVAVAREMTKYYETWYRGSVSEVLSQFQQNNSMIKGEFTIVLSGREEQAIDVTEDELKLSIENYIHRGLSSKEAIREVAKDYKLSRRFIYHLHHDLD